MNYNNNKQLLRIIISALREDIGKSDITTNLVITQDRIIKAVLTAKEGCVVCGLDIARLVFRSRDKKIKFKPEVSDGQRIKKGKVLAKIQGNARAILTAERVALNFLSLLSGIATKTRRYVNKVKPYEVKIMDTRKTIPGLRGLEKYAVKVGGGCNHRFKLDEMVLVKDNHLKVIGGYKGLRGLGSVRGGCQVELEVNSLREFKEALNLNPDIIMLDNIKMEDIKKAVKIRNGLSPDTAGRRPKLEVSGGIKLKNIRKFASLGVDMISIGDLTHSLEAIDISLEVS